MEIRVATLADLNAALGLDDSFETEHVWQMEERNEAGRISIGFHLTRLPRAMKVSGLVSRDAIGQNYQQGGVVLVADTEGAVEGFLDLSLTEWNQTLLINNIVVTPSRRRHGIASRLVRSALDWGRQQKLRVALVHAPTKAFPAIAFLQRQGFTFCGFSDRFYPNRDIAMQFALNLR